MHCISQSAKTFLFVCWNAMILQEQQTSKLVSQFAFPLFATLSSSLSQHTKYTFKQMNKVNCQIETTHNAQIVEIDAKILHEDHECCWMCLLMLSAKIHFVCE